MYVDIPEIKRCCCCVPARYGLLIWTYIRLMFSMLLMLPIIMLNVLFFRYLGVVFTSLSVLAALVLLLDVAMNIMALVGGHTKRSKLLHLYYKYSIFSLVLYSILYALLVVLNLESVLGYYPASEPIIWSYVAWFAVVGFGSLSVQIYMLLLLRSIMKKLGSNCNFRFLNHAADAEIECIFDIDKTIWKDHEEGSMEVYNGRQNILDPIDITVEYETNLKRNNDDSNLTEDNANVNELLSEIKRK